MDSDSQLKGAEGREQETEEDLELITKRAEASSFLVRQMIEDWLPKDYNLERRETVPVKLYKSTLQEKKVLQAKILGKKAAKEKLVKQREQEEDSKLLPSKAKKRKTNSKYF